MTRPQRLRVGIAGLGMAGSVMTPVIATHPRLAVAGAADRHPWLLERFRQDFAVPVHGDIAEMAKRDDIDAIYIATPQRFHAEHVRIVAAAGKHVVVEKPMAMSLAECDDMVSAARAAAAVLIVGHTHSFDPSVKTMRRLIAEGRTGRPILLNGFNYTNFMYRPRHPEELTPAQGGGVLWNQMPHFFDSVRLLVGEPVRSVRAMTASLDSARGADGCCTVFIEFLGGAAASLVYSGYDRFDSDEWLDWTGASGNRKGPAHGSVRRALSSIGGCQESSERATRWSYGGDALGRANIIGLPHFGQLIVSCERAEMRYASGGVVLYDERGMETIQVPPHGERPAHIAVWDELCDAVFDDIAPVHDGSFARGTVELCLAVAESARTRHEKVLHA